MNRDLEIRHFFMIMSNLAAAKAVGDLDAASEWIDELDAAAMHAAPVFAARAAYEAELARNWHDDTALGLPSYMAKIGNVAMFAASAPSN